MRNITSIFRQMLAALLCLCASVANAQFTLTITQNSNSDYSPVYAEFKLSEVATQLGTDTTTLVKALNDWYDAGDNTTQLFGIPDETSASGINSGYNADGLGSYWLNLDGSLGAWGSNSVYNSLLSYDAEDDYFVIPLGHYPGTEGTATLQFLLIVDGHKVTFDITYEIVVKVFTLNTLNIVGSAEISSERYSTHGYTPTTITDTIADIAEKLGIEKSLLESDIAEMTYAARVDDMGYKSDTLALVSTTNGWSIVVPDENGDATQECCLKNWDAADYMFLQEFAYVAESDELSFIAGNYPGNAAVGDANYIDLYIINEGNAYKIRYTMNIVEAPVISFDEMTKAGELDLSYQMEPRSGYDTETVPTAIDYAALAEEMGCAESDLVMYALGESGLVSDDPAVDGGGWWFNLAGLPWSWGDGSDKTDGAVFYITGVDAGDYSQLAVGQYPYRLENGDTIRTTLILMGTTSYYQINFTLTISTEEKDQNWKNKGTRKITITHHLDTAYGWSATATLITNDELNDLIGTTSPILYGEANGEDVINKYTNTYTCTPHPGFWLTPEGKVTIWGSNSYWGISTAYDTLSDGIPLNAIQMPEQTAVGDVYTGNFYLVNEATSSMVTIKITYKIVEDSEEEVVSTAGEEVGRTSIVLPVQDEFEAAFSLAAIAEVLECSEDDLSDGQTLTDVSGAISKATPSAGIEFNSEGEAVSAGSGIFGIYFESGNIYVFANDDVDEAFDKTAEVAFEYNNKTYVVEIRFLGNEAYNEYLTPVTGIQADKQSGKLYDISGRNVIRTVKGVYIQDGKKFTVK